MALVSSGINKVRAFELPAGIWADGGVVAASRSILVKWQSSWSDKFYQVYVNDQFAGATVDSQQRQMMIQIRSSLQSPVRIEVFAVEADEANIDFSSSLDSSIGDSGRVAISMLRDQDLPAGAMIEVYSNNGSGDVDYNQPITDMPIEVWPCWQDKAGFGMGGFSDSDFGYDSAAAVGFGKGIFGRGWFGSDADAVEWESEQLAAGVYKFGVKVIDEAGNVSSSTETSEITVIPAPSPAADLEVDSFDKQTNELVLSVS